jgi:hypothetical protein
MSDSIFRKGDRVRFVPGVQDLYPPEADITGFAAAPHPLDGEWPVVTYERDGKSWSHTVHPSHLGTVVNRDRLGREDPDEQAQTAVEIVAEFLDSDLVRDFRATMASLNETMRRFRESLEGFHMDLARSGLLDDGTDEKTE